MKVLLTAIAMLFAASLAAAEDSFTVYQEINLTQKQVRELHIMNGDRLVVKKRIGFETKELSDLPRWIFEGIRLASFPENFTEGEHWEDECEISVLQFAPLPFQRTTHVDPMAQAARSKTVRIRYLLKSRAQKQLLPIDEKEEFWNRFLNARGLEAIEFEGEGRALVDLASGRTLTHQFVLQGKILGTEKKEQDWLIRWAQGRVF